MNVHIYTWFVYLQDLVSGPHTRGHSSRGPQTGGGGKLDERTGTLTGYDIASLAPEPSTEWQAGTEECPDDCHNDAC